VAFLLPKNSISGRGSLQKKALFDQFGTFFTNCVSCLALFLTPKTSHPGHEMEFQKCQKCQWSPTASVDFGGPFGHLVVTLNQSSHIVEVAIFIALVCFRVFERF